jgi:methanogenic corrinoid protein MtbC1
MADHYNIHRIDPVSSAAAQAYQQERAVMAGMVDRRLEMRPDIDALIGGNTRRMMFDNHRNHAEFISTVLVFGQYRLLPMTLPWVYRAYLGQGFQPDYFVSALQAWKDTISAHLTPAQSAEILPLYDWMLDHHDTSLTAARQHPETYLTEGDDWSEPRRRYFEALRDGAMREAFNIAAALVQTSDHLLPFFDRVISPAMGEIGLRWELGELSPAREHRATAISIRVLARLSHRLPPPPLSRGRALVGAAPNEYHELGAQMLAMLLEQDGWALSYLGADTPEEDFLGLACEERPDLIALSVAMPYNVERAAALIHSLRQTPELAGSRIMIGGHAFSMLPEVGHALQPDALPASLAEAVSIARTWSVR